MSIQTLGSLRRGTGVVVCAALAFAFLTGAAGAADRQSREAGTDPRAVTCAEQLDRAERQYVRTTHQRNADGFNALLDRDVTAILRQGEIFDGKPAVATFIEEFFATPGWTQTFQVLKKVVRGCSTAFVLYESRYREPANCVDLHLIIGVTFTRHSGRWLVLHNQDSGRPIRHQAAASL